MCPTGNASAHYSDSCWCVDRRRVAIGAKIKWKWASGSVSKVVASWAIAPFLSAPSRKSDHPDVADARLLSRAGSAATVLLASRLNLPVSTAQCLTGSVMGVALMNYDLGAAAAGFHLFQLSLDATLHWAGLWGTVCHGV